MSQGKVLCLSYNKRVSDDRCSMLMQAGYNVVPCSDVEDALALLDRERFDAVIIGHRFATDDKYLLAVEAQEKWNTPVVLVCGATADSEIPAARRVYALQGHAAVAAALAEVMPVGAATHA